MWEAITLGILQGVAEFLPISSSGHLVLGRNLLGLGEVGLRLDICLHVGTLAAVFAYYISSIRRIIIGREWQYVAKLILSAVPAGIVGLVFASRIESVLARPAPVAASLIFTGWILIMTRLMKRGKHSIGFGAAIWMGLAQALAVLPGVSRSGMTLVASRLCGIEAEKAAEFSFLMSALPIAGAAFLEAIKTSGVAAGSEVPWGACIVGALVAAIVGYFSLKLLVSSLKGRWFWLFGPYCVVVGLLALWRYTGNV